MSTTCQIWDADTGRPASPLLPHINWVAALAFSPDAKVLATGDYSGAVHLWDVRTGTMIGRPFGAGSIVVSVAFSHDGRLLAAGTAEPSVNQAVLWDLGTGRAWREPVRFGGWAEILAFSPDNSDLGVGASDGSVKVIETATGRVRAALRCEGRYAVLHSAPTAGSSSPTTEQARGVLFDCGMPRTGEPVSPVISYPRLPWAPPIFSPDGAMFAATLGNRSVRLWDVATVRPIGATVMLRDECRSLAFRPDGQSLLTVDERGNLKSWPVPRRAEGTIESLMRRVQVRTDMQIDKVKEIAILSPDEWEQLRAEGGDLPLSPEPDDEQDWHERNARDAEALSDGFGARWHLDRLIAERPKDALLRVRRARAWLWSRQRRSRRGRH